MVFNPVNWQRFAAALFRRSPPPDPPDRVWLRHPSYFSQHDDHPHRTSPSPGRSRARQPQPASYAGGDHPPCWTSQPHPITTDSPPTPHTPSYFPIPHQALHHPETAGQPCADDRPRPAHAGRHGNPRTTHFTGPWPAQPPTDHRHSAAETPSCRVPPGFPLHPGSAPNPVQHRHGGKHRLIRAMTTQHCLSLTIDQNSQMRPMTRKHHTQTAPIEGKPLNTAPTHHRMNRNHHHPLKPLQRIR